jgi:hypothetical protein
VRLFQFLFRPLSESNEDNLNNFSPYPMFETRTTRIQVQGITFTPSSSAVMYVSIVVIEYI